MKVPLPITAIMTWTAPDGRVCKPTEGNRSELSVSTERIKNSTRMANGRLREYYVADKRTWSVSWDMIPAPSLETVEENAGGSEIENFYTNTPTEFSMKISHADPKLDGTYTVVFSSFDKSHVKRGKFDFWNISLSVTEC